MKRIPSYPTTKASRDLEEQRIEILKLFIEYNSDTSVVNCVSYYIYLKLFL